MKFREFVEKASIAGDGKEAILETNWGTVDCTLVKERSVGGWFVCSDDEELNGGFNETAKQVGRKYGWVVQSSYDCLSFFDLRAKVKFISEDDL